MPYKMPFLPAEHFYLSTPLDRVRRAIPSPGSLNPDTTYSTLPQGPPYMSPVSFLGGLILRCLTCGNQTITPADPEQTPSQSPHPSSPETTMNDQGGDLPAGCVSLSVFINPGINGSCLESRWVLGPPELVRGAPVVPVTQIPGQGAGQPPANAANPRVEAVGIFFEALNWFSAFFRRDQ